MATTRKSHSSSSTTRRSVRTVVPPTTPSRAHTSPRTTLAARLGDVWDAVRRPCVRWWYRYQNFLSRRPHRSFRWTRRRDVPAMTPLPSNIFFTSDVFAIIRRYARSYLGFASIYVVAFTALTGIISQENYQAFSGSLRDIVGGDLGKAGETWTLFTTVVSGQLSTSLSEVQQVYVSLLSLFAWMSIVWFLRHRLGGAVVNVRDALYNAGAPLLPTLMIAIVGLFQMVPGAVGIITYVAATSAGVVTGGVESMLFAVAAVLLVVLSLYWLTSTIFGLVIVTLPGTYPFRALSLAGDVVVGRRSSLLLRLLWMGFIVLLLWVFILVPAILLADALPWKWLPIVPLVTQLLAGASILFAASYVYVLYRRMLDAAPKKRRR